MGKSSAKPTETQILARKGNFAKTPLSVIGAVVFAVVSLTKVWRLGRSRSRDGHQSDGHPMGPAQCGDGT